MRTFILVAILLTLLTAASADERWDCFYGCSVLPNDPSLGASAWMVGGDLSMCSTDGDVLCIDDRRADARVYFNKWGWKGAATMEARLRVTGGTGAYDYAWLSIQSSTAWLDARMYPLRMETYPFATCTVDMSAFHTVRIAMTADRQVYVWLDRIRVLETTAVVGGQGGVVFGGPDGPDDSGTGTSYWDYVAYSHAFLPIPEPSSLLALLTGLASAGVACVRRRRG